MNRTVLKEIGIVAVIIFAVLVFVYRINVSRKQVEQKQTVEDKIKVTQLQEIPKSMRITKTCIDGYVFLITEYVSQGSVSTIQFMIKTLSRDITPLKCIRFENTQENYGG